MEEARTVSNAVGYSKSYDVGEAERRKRVLNKLNEDFKHLRADPKAWEEELKERRDWGIV